MASEAKDPAEKVDECRKIYGARQSTARRLALACCFVLIVVVGALVGRIGTDVVRIATGLSMLSMVAVMVWVTLRRSQQWRDDHFAVGRVFGAVDQALAPKVQRAYALYRRSIDLPDDGTSQELALAYAEQMLDGVALSKIAAAGQRHRRRILQVASFLALVCAALFLLQGLAVLEGLSVLAARRGIGSFPIAYVETISVSAELPSYMAGSNNKRFMSASLGAVPLGSELEVRVVPLVSDRKLLLTDGLKEVPFVSDGKGAQVARWTAEEASDLRVGVRFGQVVVYDTVKTHLSPQNDLPPSVFLQGAGEEHALDELSSLPLVYRALDDHGISQVDLVLRSGQRVERTELSQLSGQEQSYQGAYTLTPDHDLIRKAFLPVRVSIEARDGNTATGPGWGKSRAILLIPRPLGDESADRHIALRQFRAAVSGFLAADIQAGRMSAEPARTFRIEAHKELTGALEALATRLSESGKVPQRSLAFVGAQLEALGRSGQERASPESVLLAIDALISDIAHREAIELSRDLGSAVEEIAVQAREVHFNAEDVNLEGLHDLLEGAKLGAGRLREVGQLGLDIGLVAQADLARVERSLKRKEYDLAEGAALHLAERLKRATPSFSSSGGAGVESGLPESGSPGSEGGGKPDGPASEASAQFAEMSSEIDQLAQEAAGELGRLEKMLDAAREAAAADFQISPSLDAAIEKFEKSLDHLPERSSGALGPMAEAASAREQGEATLDALRAGDLAEAVERGLDTGAALKRAQDALDSGPSWLSPEQLNETQKSLQELMGQLKSAEEELARRGQARTDSSLGERGEKQKAFAERAEALAQKGTNPEAPLGEEGIASLKKAAELLRKAAQMMDSGQAESGARYAEEAQKQLEQALPANSEQGSEEGEPSEGESSGQGKESSKGSVPEEEKDRAGEFRRRVEEGLGRHGGALAPAIRRYAEDLK